MTLYESILEKGLEQGLEKGLEKGKEVGIKEGMKRGAYQEKVRLVRTASSSGFTIDQISVLSELSEKEVKKILNLDLNSEQ